MRISIYQCFAYPGFRFYLACIAMTTFFSCQKQLETSPPQNATPDETFSLRMKKADLVVSAESSIQAAVDAANPGDVIHIKPGLYKEAVIVNKPNIKLIGLNGGGKGVIIENPGNENNGITVRPDGDGFELHNVTIRNFESNGVIMIRADNFVLKHITVIDCGEYGLWPIRSNHGIIEHCTASGHSDSGIYTGQSNDIVMRFNRVFNNTIGLEIENCQDVIASNNQCYNNVTGILVVLLPGLTEKISSNITVNNNHVYKNNKINTADPADGFEAYVPSGGGILVVGSDNTLIERNTVQHNQFLGIAVVSSLTLGALAGLPPEAFGDIEPNPDGVQVRNNTVNTNGTVQPALPFPAADLLWDGSGTNNCWIGNKYKTSFPAMLPVCN
ncbi:MAG: right-handed parallel beta-helix repeat-containing protein [Chitinophagaceae bacterium]|nr:right-handed parallel beta-helix repeat-containing protein [Chitinophagaceae bacterium]